MHSITKYNYSSPTCWREMKGDAKSHHPPEWNLKGFPGLGLTQFVLGAFDMTIFSEGRREIHNLWGD